MLSPADTTTTMLSLASLKYEMVYLSVASLTELSWKNAVE